jgi:titin
MATPHVAGVVALMAAAAPGLTPAQAMANLKTSGECPDGSIAGGDASCAGQGTWPDDPDGIPEPMIHALRAAVASGNPPPPVAPGAPNLTAASAGNASVALTWSAPASDGGSPISGYQIWRGTSSGGESLLTTVGVTTGYADSSVSNGTTYYYQVAAVNAVGPGPGSNERSATPTGLVPVTRLGGTSGTFASSNSGSMSFSLPAGTDRLVAMISVYTTSTTVTSMTWKPNPGNPSLNQPLTFVGRQVASANGAVEIWELANPTPGVAGAALSHTLSANAKHVIGVHALAGVGGHGTPVGAGSNSNAISVSVPSQTGALVLDVIFGSNSTTAHTAGAGQTEHWDTNTSGGTNNLRGAGSSEAGAATTTMSWTSGSVTHHALLAVSYNPR